jgi:glycosyltransferase involved in cell wall biosynthesis
MKILFIGPLPDPVTGQSLACQVFLDELVKTHEVTVINLSKRGFAHGLDSFRRIREVLTYIWQVWRKSFGADRIYFTISESIAGNLKDMLIYLACFYKLPCMIVHLHGGAGMRELLKPSNKVLRLLNRFFLRRIGAVIVLGPRHVDIFRGITRPDQLHIVPNFAEDSMFVDVHAINLKFALTEPLRLLFVSNLIPGKGYHELVNGYKALATSMQAKVQIDFAGGFQSKQDEQEFFQSIDGISSLRYHGIVRGARKMELFHQAHLFCLPTYYPYEGQPISILEAYASGCAVMTTDHSGIFDIFAPGANGFCVEKRSVVSIREVIVRALDAPQLLRMMALHNLKEANRLCRTETYTANLMKVMQGVCLDGLEA